MTVTESFYRLVARRSAGIETLADLKGKRVMLPRNTSAHYFLVAMLRTVGLTEEEVESRELAARRRAIRPAWTRCRMHWPAATWTQSRSGSRSPRTRFIGWATMRSYFRTAACTARCSTFTPERRTWPTRTSAARSSTFVRAVAEATDALKNDPEAHWPHVSSITGFTTEEISWGWPEMEFPVRIIPDMLDVLEEEEVWVAKERNRVPRSRAELAGLIDASVLEEALASQ